MAKVSRADYAETTPWTGIIGRPASFGVADIGGLTGNGYADGNVPVYDKKTGRFKPGSRYPAPTPTPPTPTPGIPTEIFVVWDVPSLMPLQTAYEDFFFPGAMVSQPVVVGAPFATPFMQICASIVDANMARITVTNMNFSTVDLGSGTWRLQTIDG